MVLCCHYNCNNIHTYACSDYVKTKQTRYSSQKEKKDQGQEESGFLSHTFSFGLGCCEGLAHSICFLLSDAGHTEKTFSHIGIYLSLTLEKLFVPFQMNVQNKREVYTCLPLNHGTSKVSLGVHAA